MKKFLLSMMVMALFSVAAFAQEPQDKPAMTEPGMMQGQMMCGMGMHMMGKSLVPVKDGFVVMIGTKLMKYDNNLNLVKEVEIKVDMKEMQMKMNQMMEMCPMMKKRMMEEQK